LNEVGLTRESSVDAFLTKTGSQSVYIDALLSELNITKEISIDAFIYSIIYKTISIDSFLTALNIEKTIDLDAILSHVGLTIESSLDALLNKVAQSKITSLDAFLAFLGEETINLDSLLHKIGLTKEVTLDAILNKTGLLKTVSLDSLLNILGLNRTTTIDSYLQESFEKSLSLDSLIYGVYTKIAQLLHQLYSGEIELTQIRSIIRSYGDGMPVHHDDDPYRLDVTTRYGFVLYLNDDYTGGEIYYPKLNIEYKPKVGDLVIHPGSEEYSHGVRDIVSGERYNITLFAHTK
jgi:hypothetical protein